MQQLTHLIEWKDWSPGAFALAHELDRPVLLFLEQFWCALCRLMDETSWRDEIIRERIEAGFVPVRVDAARRPDIDRRFRMGGWPTLSFLTPQAHIITGSTFLPPEAVLNALDGVQKLYHTKRSELDLRASEAEEAHEALQAGRMDSLRQPSPWMTAKVLDNIRAAADRDFGGFGEAPKFPHFDAIRLLLKVCSRAPDDNLLTLATDALDGMLQSGLYDWEDGGFFRSSDGADWSSPRLEKLLSDQARHIQCFLLAHRLTGELEYAEAVSGVLDYCERMLFDPASSVFANSQVGDAAYYLLGRQEREHQPPPPVDRTVFLESNCQMARALLQIGKDLQDSSFVPRALSVFEAVQSLLWPDGELAFRYFDGEPRVQGLLVDQCELGLTLLALSDETGDAEFLEKARRLGALINQTFGDEGHPGYFDAVDPLGLGLLRVRDKAYEDNMLLASFYGRLARASGDESWVEMALNALRAFTGVWERLGVASAAYGLALYDVFAG